MNKKQKTNLIRIIVTAILLSVLYLIFETDLLIPGELNPLLERGIFLIPYIIIGYDVIIKSIKGISKGQIFDENFLMGVASIGAFAIGECVEGVAVVLFYQVGELFESYALGKSRRSITELMDITEDFCYVVSGDEVVRTDSYDVEVGSIIEVRPGDKVPIDGIIVEGNSTLDSSALTGESRYCGITVGDEVLSGTINISSVIRIKTSVEFEESTASKILDMIESAGLNKSRSENFISKFSYYYTPIVCILAVIIAIIPPLVNGLLLGQGYLFTKWIYTALTFLVISCPCALVISVPLSFFAGIGAASTKGIMIKGSNYLEMLSKIDTIYFDKTGTLTKGNFKVSSLYLAANHNTIDLASNDDISPSDLEIIRLAASCEYYLSHPIARSLIDAYIEAKTNSNKALSDYTSDEANKLMELYLSKPINVAQLSGKGVTAIVDGKNVAVGNELLMKETITDIEKSGYVKASEVGTIVYISVDGSFAGYIVINDEIKEDSRKAIEDLYKAGIESIGILTGDEESVADDIAAKLRLNKVRANLLPADKLSVIESEIDKGHKVSFVGDGLNDAPVIMRADVGIAMGALGSDAAIEASDIVLMDDSPRKVALAIQISKKCMKIVYENITFSIGIKVIVLLLSLVGIATMWMAIFADVGVMILAVLNAIRCLRVRWKN